MKRTQINPGDLVTLGRTSGLGSNPFLVLQVLPGDLIHNLYVQGLNGQTWWARLEGARVVSPMQSSHT